MAKSNTFSSPQPPGGDQDSVEIDRFPPRRVNQKETKRTVAILVGAIVTLIVGVGLRATVFAPRYNIAPPPDTELMEADVPAEARGSDFTNRPITTGATAPAPLAGASPGAPGPLSPFDNSPSPSPAASPGVDTKIGSAYNPFVSSSGETSPAAATSPAPAFLPGAAGKPAAPGALSVVPPPVEPPVISSLSQSGGVYKPALPPPPLGGGSSSTSTPGSSSNATSGSGGAGSGGLYVAPRF